MSLRVKIIYGFTEGEWHGKKFRRLLREQGHTIVKDASTADIIIAHSGGCYNMPTPRKEQRVMLINPPYWPGKSLKERGGNMIKHLASSVRPGNQPFYQLHKTSRNAVYLIRHQRTNKEMLLRAQTYNLAEQISHPHIILVRNYDDPWLTPDLAHLKAINPKLIIRSLSGGHDDCWLHPEPYINLL